MEKMLNSWIFAHCWNFTLYIDASKTRSCDNAAEHLFIAQACHGYPRPRGDFSRANTRVVYTFGFFPDSAL